MGFALTAAYVAMTLLSPAAQFPELAPYRIMLALALVSLMASVPRLFERRFKFLPQFYLVLGLIVAICLSRLLNGWPGGIPPALGEFLPAAIIFFLIVWNVTSISRLRILSSILILVGLYFVARGAIAFYRDDPNDLFVFFQRGETGAQPGFLRIRGLGILNDPNDLAQYLLLILPLLLPVWKPRKQIRNLVFVVLPAAALLYGVYLTNSRGAIISLALMVVFLVKDRLGSKRSALLAPLVIAGILMLNQSGRSMSIQEDSAMGRVNAWSDGLGMFERSPLWGIGYGLFTDYHERTAHNSFVLCLAELGLAGVFIWLGLLVSCVLFLQKFHQTCESDEERRWAFALRASLYPFLATSWFLSRTYSPPLYLMVGMTAALIGLRPAAEYRAAPRCRWVRTTALVLPVLTMFVYITVRMRSV